MLALYFALTPIFFGLFAPLWFGVLLTPVRRIRQGARWLDEQCVTTPSVELTIRALREHEKCGDKLVVAHHLAKWSRELQRKISQHLLYGGAISLVLVIVLTVANDRSLQRSPSPFHDLLSAVNAHIPISLLLAASFIEILVIVRMISDQAVKYADVILAAKPPQKPLLSRMYERLRARKA